MSKKVRVDDKLIGRLKEEGPQSLNRTELRALGRKGYVTAKKTTNSGTIRYDYKIDMRII